MSKDLFYELQEALHPDYCPECRGMDAFCPACMGTGMSFIKQKIEKEKQMEEQLNEEKEKEKRILSNINVEGIAHGLYNLIKAIPNGEITLWAGVVPANIEQILKEELHFLLSREMKDLSEESIKRLANAIFQNILTALWKIVDERRKPVA